ncbi:MAG: PDZ domain-containing protein, partial [Planctomycetota bacterium]|nr:PDZ domain-containing protein [Planctomycetota bacterium]
KRGIDAQHVALEVLGLFKPAARRSGLRTGDVIVSYDGKKEPLGAPKFEDYLRLHHFRADSVLRLEVLRDGEVRRVDVKLGAREGRAP